MQNIIGKQALSILIMPPSEEELQNRLKKRNTESEETLKKRISRANEELMFADKFDVVVVNDDLQKAIEEVRTHIAKFTTQTDEK